MPFPQPTTSFSPVENILCESVNAQAILHAARLNIFDHLEERPMDTDALAQKTGLAAKPLEALLDMLAGRGLLSKNDATYANTPMTSEYLVNTSPLYQGKAMELNERFYALVRDSMPEVLSGQSMERAETDKSWSTPETMDGTLQHALNGQLQMAVDFIAEMPEFPSMRTMADIGGNHGHYSMELLHRNPKLQSTLFDLEHVLEAAAKRCRANGYGDRVTCLPLDIRTDSLPDKAFDMVFTSHVLYACTPELDAVFKNIHASLKPGGCVVSHHFTQEGGASRLYRDTTEFIARLAGYETHHLSRNRLESSLRKAGFNEFEHTYTGCDKNTLLLVARRD
jgi:SAM-dependent methyltransferase